MPKPELVENLHPETTHREALRWIVRNCPGGLSIATGYVNLEGLASLAEVAGDVPVRLMIGAEPGPGLGAGTTPAVTFRSQIEALRGERDFHRFPPSRQGRLMARVDELLARDGVEVRRYGERFLHGKAYIAGRADGHNAALVTSANLTGAGLSRNLELGLAQYQPGIWAAADRWFDRLWDQAHDYLDELRELLFPAVEAVTPQDVYLRALLELHRPLDMDPERATRPRIDLAPFQRDGYERAREIMARHGGVIYADGVGTGKTEIGLAFVEETTRESGEHALIVTPPQLKGRWEERIEQARLAARVITFQELASDEQLTDDRGPGIRRRLKMQKDAYRLVIVDEAHALRNEDTTWHRAMERLLGGTRKRVLLLTATPINNSLWDLFNLVMLFARHDLGLASAGIDSIRELFVKAGANSGDPEDLKPDLLYPLAEAVAVRRDRVFIEKNYPRATFPGGMPVRFPAPHLDTPRYDLDEAHPDLVEEITRLIGRLTMARYQPSRYLLGDRDAESHEIQVAGLILSGLLKRFESCWRACLGTVRRMITAHETFLEAWATGTALTGEALIRAVSEEFEEGDLAGWIAAEKPEGSEATTAYDSRFAADVAADRDRLREIADLLDRLSPEDDPKLRMLRRLLEESPAEKVAVFATFADTVRYLDEQLPRTVGGRERVTVIGTDTDPDQRTAMMTRFTPHSIAGPEYEAEGEVDILLATDVLSEGQNMQQAQAVISYDMPWNPQRVVQRNGRVIRLMSPHDEVLLTTMLPERGELEAILGLEARIQGKIKAAGVFGMESEVIAARERDEVEREEREIVSFSERLVDGDPDLLDDQEMDSGAFVGEELRRFIDRKAQEGFIARVEALPWGVGACFRQGADTPSQGSPGIFFATRTPATTEFDEGFRYWRYVRLDDLGTSDVELEILRVINPGGAPGLELPDAAVLERAWRVAAAEIVNEHNERIRSRAHDSLKIGPRQRWAVDLLREPDVNVPSEDRADLAVQSLQVARSTAVRRQLAGIEHRLGEGEISRDQAALAIIELVEAHGLRPVDPLATPDPVTEEDLGVVCWMAVLGNETGIPAS